MRRFFKKTANNLGRSVLQGGIQAASAATGAAVLGGNHIPKESAESERII